MFPGQVTLTISPSSSPVTVCLLQVQCSSPRMPRAPERTFNCARRSSNRAARAARASPSALMPVTSFWTRCGAAAHACPVVSVHSRNLVSCSGIPHAGLVIGISTIYGCADRRDALTPGNRSHLGCVPPAVRPAARWPLSRAGSTSFLVSISSKKCQLTASQKAAAVGHSRLSAWQQRHRCGSIGPSDTAAKMTRRVHVWDGNSMMLHSVSALDIISHCAAVLLRDHLPAHPEAGGR